MGWTGVYMQRPRGTDNLRNYFQQEFGPKNNILAFSVRGNVAYSAVDNAAGEVFGLVILMASYQGEFQYKYVDESMGPNESECPAYILDMLTPTESEYALEWRDRCRKNAAIKNASKISVGDILEFTEAINYGGQSDNRFKVVKYGKRKVFESVNYGFLGRIPRKFWLREFKKV